jgi:hypothetical protein
MKEDNQKLLIAALLMIAARLILAALAYGVALIIWANQCGAAGGTYIIPKAGFPVCVQGIN